MSIVYAGRFDSEGVEAGSIRRLSVGGGRFTHPAMAPDGTAVAYWGIRQGRCELWLSPLRSGETGCLSDFGGASYHPAWAPDSRRIVYSHMPPSRLPPGWLAEQLYSSPPVPRDLWILDVSSGERRQITFGVEDDERPAWSADGKTIAFVRSEGDSKTIWLIDPESGTQSRVTDPGVFDYRPAWHPDGDMLALNNKGPGNHYLWLVRWDGSRRQQLTPAAGAEPMVADHGSTWSSDGRQVRFHSNRGGTWGIWSIAVASREMRPIPIPGFLSASHPTWSADEGWLCFDSTEER